MELPSKLNAAMQAAWTAFFSGSLRFSPTPPSTEDGMVVEIRSQGMTHGWLVTDSRPSPEPAAVALLEGWATLLAEWAGEQRTSSGLSEQVFEAWDRLGFMHQLMRMMRIQTDTTGAAFAAFDLTANTISANNGFIAWKTHDAVTRHWLAEAVPEPVFRLLVETLHPGEIIYREYLTPETDAFAGTTLTLSNGVQVQIGMIKGAGEAFDAGDLQLIESLAEHLISLFELDILYAEHASNQKMSADVAIAAEVQASFLPREISSVPGYEFAASLTPAAHVSGDYYDLVLTRDNTLWMMVCDVAGKGLPAALLAAGVRGTVRAAGDHNYMPGEVLQEANMRVYEDMVRIERFATAMIAHLWPNTHELRYSNAGHTTGLWIQANPLRVVPLPSTTLPLGILEDIDPESPTINIAPGDMILMYSDGLTEMENAAQQILGQAGVIDVLLAIHEAPAQYIHDSLIERSLRHRDGLPLSDDLTLVVIKRKPETPRTARYLKRIHLPGTLDAMNEAEELLLVLAGYLPEDDGGRRWLIELQLSFVEVITNIIRHAYAELKGEIHGLLAVYDSHLEIDLFDTGIPYAETPREELDFVNGPPDGGYGLHIIYSVMDLVQYERLPNGYSHWKLVRNLP